MEKFVIRKVDIKENGRLNVKYSFTGDHRLLEMDLLIKEKAIDDFILESLAKLYRLDEVQMCYGGKCYRYNKDGITSFNLYRRK